MRSKQTPVTNHTQLNYLSETAGQAGKTWNKTDLTAAGLDFIIAQETERNFDEGQYHQGLSSVVQVVAKCV